MADKKISQLTAATTPLAGTESVPIVQSGGTVKVPVSDLTAGRDVSVANLTATGSLHKLGNVTMTDITVQIGPDTPITTSSARILFSTSSTQYNWFLTHNWNTAGAVTLAQSTAAGGTTMGSDVHQWLSNGDYKLVNGNLVIGTSGKGIDFSATSDATGMTSELLDDYEEGTWTPTMTASSSGTITLNGSFTGGKYTKIGRQVTVTAYLYVASVSSPAGDLFIAGLPFTSGGDIGNYSSANVWANGQNATSVTTIFARVARSDTNILLQNYASGTVSALAGKVQAGNEFSISATYFV